MASVADHLLRHAIHHEVETESHAIHSADKAQSLRRPALGFNLLRRIVYVLLK